MLASLDAVSITTAISKAFKRVSIEMLKSCFWICSFFNLLVCRLDFHQIHNVQFISSKQLRVH